MFLQLLLACEVLGEQILLSGESAHFPPMCPGPGHGVICGLSLLVLYSALRGLSLGTLVFPFTPTVDLIYFDLIYFDLIYLID